MVPAVVLATAGYDHKIRFWEASTRVCTRTLRHPDSQVNTLAISPDKRYLAAAGNPFVRIFDVANAANANPIVTFEGHTTNVVATGFEHSARWIYSGSEDGTVRIWDMRSGGCQRTYECRAPPSADVTG